MPGSRHHGEGAEAVAEYDHQIETAPITLRGEQSSERARGLAAGISVCLTHDRATCLSSSSTCWARVTPRNQMQPILSSSNSSGLLTHPSTPTSAHSNEATSPPSLNIIKTNTVTSTIFKREQYNTAFLVSKRACTASRVLG